MDLRSCAVLPLLPLLLLCAACGAAGGDGPTGRELAQPVGEMRMSGVGDPLVTLTRQRRGPPPSGPSDILGGSGGGAATVLTYRGLQDGRALFERHDILIYEPEGMERTLLDGGRSVIELDPARLPESIVIDGIFLRIVEADRFIVRYLLSRNPLGELAQPAAKGGAAPGGSPTRSTLSTNDTRL